MAPASSAHTMVQAGRAQQITDDVLYLLECADAGQPGTMRAPALSRLATHCTESDFARQLRAQGFLEPLTQCLTNPADDEVRLSGFFFIVIHCSFCSGVGAAYLNAALCASAPTWGRQPVSGASWYIHKQWYCCYSSIHFFWCRPPSRRLSQCRNRRFAAIVGGPSGLAKATRTCFAASQRHIDGFLTSTPHRRVDGRFCVFSFKYVD